MGSAKGHTLVDEEDVFIKMWGVNQKEITAFLLGSRANLWRPVLVLFSIEIPEAKETRLTFSSPAKDNRHGQRMAEGERNCV